ncbi:MAG: hypothetical protein P1V81_04950 [Planctomycetota bacterium]|nr:hypothetical protein [Planctomycetota bacterium]
MRNLVLLLLVLVLASCQSLQRLGRVSPLAGEVAEDRINLWPLYYQNGSEVAVLWPIFDVDEQGFALRPLVTHDGSDWEVLPPIVWWDADSDDWIFVPAYSLEGSWGLFPVFGFGDLSYVGPAWWSEDGGGLFPLAAIGDGVSWVGPVWWRKDAAGDVATHGLFPLYTHGERLNNVGPVVWERNEAGELAYLMALPLLGFAHRDDGSGMVLGLFGGRGWDAAGETTWLNVLGPVYHRSRSGDDQSTHLLWPFAHWSDGTGGSDWYLWPLLGSETSATDVVPVEGGADGAADSRPVARTRTWALAGLIEGSGSGGLDSLRVAPLFSHRSAAAGGADLLDWLTLFGHQSYGDGARSLHLGTPLGFHHDQSGDTVRWGALLDILDYEADGTDSSFELLWYLYRQRTTGNQTRRDLFPFISWDTGEDSTEFSFLWRLLHYESDGDRRGGHLLFLPWGDTD